MVIRVELFIHKLSQTNVNWHYMITHGWLCSGCLLSGRACGWIARMYFTMAIELGLVSRNYPFGHSKPKNPAFDVLTFHPDCFVQIFLLSESEFLAIFTNTTTAHFSTKVESNKWNFQTKFVDLWPIILKVGFLQNFLSLFLIFLPNYTTIEHS